MQININRKNTMNHEKHKSYIMTLTEGSRRKTPHFFECDRGVQWTPLDYFWGPIGFFFVRG